MTDGQLDKQKEGEEEGRREHSSLTSQNTMEAGREENSQAGKPGRVL